MKKILIILSFLCCMNSSFGVQEDHFNVVIEIQNTVFKAPLMIRRFSTQEGQDLACNKNGFKDAFDMYVRYEIDRIHIIDEERDFPEFIRRNLRSSPTREKTFVNYIASPVTNKLIFSIGSEEVEFGWTMYNWKEEIDHTLYNRFFFNMKCKEYNHEALFVKCELEEKIDFADHMHLELKNILLGYNFYTAYKLKFKIYESGICCNPPVLPGLKSQLKKFFSKD